MEISKTGPYIIDINWQKVKWGDKPPCENISSLAQAETFDFRRFIADFGVGLGMKMEAKGLFLSMRISKNTPRFFSGNPIIIKELFDNISRHCLYFIDEGGLVIEIESEPENDLGLYTLMFSFTASGLGIPPDKVSSIYEPCLGRQINRESGTEPNLYIAKCLTGIMCGNISVNNTFGFGVRYDATIRLEAVRQPSAH